MKSFEDFLREKHAKKEYVDVKYTYDWWIQSVNSFDLINYAEEWHRQEIKNTFKEINKILQM